MRKVAIIGRCHSTRSDAPYHDPTWEKWVLAWDPIIFLPCHRIFELHTNFRMFLGSQEEGDFHVSGLRMAKVPVYMLDKQDDIAQSVRYPMEEVTELVGKTSHGFAYLESSIAYMLALAILERVDRVGIWGVDLHCESEYAYQRPNLEYLIGLARGRGTKVFIPPWSHLLTSKMDKPYGHYSATDAGAPQTPLPQGQAA